MKCYWGQAENTAGTLHGGWLHAGDAGRIDRDGYVTMRGRYSELIEVAASPGSRGTWKTRSAMCPACWRLLLLDCLTTGWERGR
jgi:AMP-binding enzyme